MMLLESCHASLMNGFDDPNIFQQLGDPLGSQSIIFMYSSVQCLVKAMELPEIASMCDIYMVDQKRRASLLLDIPLHVVTDPKWAQLTRDIPRMEGVLQHLQEGIREQAENDGTSFVIYSQREFPLLLTAIKKGVVAYALQQNPSWSKDRVPVHLIRRVRSRLCLKEDQSMYVGVCCMLAGCFAPAHFLIQSMCAPNAV
jgi:hypothetical protein